MGGTATAQKIGTIVNTTAAAALYVIMGGAPLANATGTPSVCGRTYLGGLTSLREWELRPRNPFYDFSEEAERSSHHIGIVRKFASKLLNETRDLDQETVAFVNRHFWDLL